MNELLDLLRPAVENAFSDDRVNVVCSGGLDSSTIACVAAELNGDEPVHLWTGWYDEHGFDERSFSRLVPGVHHEVEITAEDFVAEFDNMARALLPPWQGMGLFGQWMVAKAMAENGVRVALSGEGADELFGGYARLMKVAGAPLPDNYPRDYRPPAGYPDTLEQALEWEMAHLDDLLAADTAILAAHGIEGRAPFTDPFVTAWALSQPPWLRVNKTLLRKAVLGVVPEPIWQRKTKMGFPVPLVKWAQQEPVKSFVQDRIGYLPSKDQPWARGWWEDLLEATVVRVVTSSQ